MKTKHPLVALEMRTHENTVDGCIDCGCRLKTMIERGRSSDWWITFGLVVPDSVPNSSGMAANWQVWTASSHCGPGTFSGVEKDFAQTVGIPYLVYDLSIAPVSVSKDEIDLRVTLQQKKLSKFHGDQPGYQGTDKERQFRFAPSNREVVFPLLLADSTEKELFQIHEVLVRMTANVPGTTAPASYGAVAVSADAPGAEILIDGGVVGQIGEGHPAVIDNVLAGNRMISVRDLSGRTVHQKVMIVEGKCSR